MTARLAYVAIVLLATLTRLQFSPEMDAAGDRLVRAFSPAIAWRDAIDGLRNVALFAGLGMVWVATSRFGGLREELREATLAGLGLSALVEGLQIFSPVRTASVLDIVTNALGSLAGAVAVAELIVRARAARGARSYVGVPTWLFAGGYGLAVLSEALTPLFRSQPVDLIVAARGPLDQLRAALHYALPLSAREVPVLDVLLYAPAGFLAVMWLGERGQSPGNAWRRVAAAGAGLALVAEVVHGAFSLSVRWEAAGTHALALGAGAWTAARWLPLLTHTLRGAARARATLGAYAVLLVAWGWRPFLPEIDHQAISAQLVPERLIPVYSLLERIDVFSALHVLQQFALYLPLGALLAVWPLERAGRWAGLRPGLWLAAAIELGHIVIAGRYFDFTNVLVAGAGMAIGWVVVRRSGYAPYGVALPL